MQTRTKNNMSESKCYRNKTKITKNQICKHFHFYFCLFTFSSFCAWLVYFNAENLIFIWKLVISCCFPKGKKKQKFGFFHKFHVEQFHFIELETFHSFEMRNNNLFDDFKVARLFQHFERKSYNFEKCQRN